MEEPALRLIAKGDDVKVDMTCRLKTGELVMTTLKEVAESPDKPKATIFQFLKTYAPVSVKAGDGQFYSGNEPLRSFTGEILAGVSNALVGMQAGETRTITLEAVTDPAIKPEDRYIQLARLRTYPKEIKAPKAEYQRIYAKEPEVGAEVEVGIGVTGRIARIHGDQLWIKPDLTDTGMVQTPWGPAEVSEKEDKFELSILPEAGRLVRTGPYVGRVDRIEADSYIMDFGHPFGSAVLVCEIRVREIHTGEKGQVK
ncbi:MAG: hypothetical protein ACOZF0_17550 [Thermodesulfobacteriota bacterium]